MMLLSSTPIATGPAAGPHTSAPTSRGAGSTLSARRTFSRLPGSNSGVLDYPYRCVSRLRGSWPQRFINGVSFDSCRNRIIDFVCEDFFGGSHAHAFRFGADNRTRGRRFYNPTDKRNIFMKFPYAFYIQI